MTDVDEGNSVEDDEGALLVFREHEGPDGGLGRTIGFAGGHVVPRGYDDLSRLGGGAPVSLEFELVGARVVDTDIAGVASDLPANVRTTIETPFTARAIALVEGGWLPSSFAALDSRSVVLPDRNVSTEIVARFEGGRNRGREPDFLDLFEGRAVRINPSLYALEGNARAAPDAALARRQLDEAVDKLRAALPDARIVVGPDTLAGLLGTIEDGGASMAAGQEFLLAVAPRLASPTSKARFDAVWREVVDTADQAGVRPDSFLLLAALASLAIPGGPAHRVLKPRPGYDRGDAYAAMCDLRALELLVHLIARFPEHRTQVCTADRALALLWCGLGVRGIGAVGPTVSYSLDPHPGILPRDLRERWERDVGGTRS